jgi:hypothetical protein
MGKAKAKKAQGDRKIESITIKDMVIDGERISIEKSSLIENSNITVYTILATETKDNYKSGKNEAVELNMTKVKEWFKKNHKEIVKDAKQIQINSFTEAGWRGGGIFNPKTDVPTWFSKKQEYDKHMEEVKAIYAFQILVYA